MAALRSILFDLSQMLRVKETAIYERQRALVRAGLLNQNPGLGRGSGVRLDPHALSILLASFLATDSLSEVPTATRELLDARYRKLSLRCPITEARTFGDAFKLVLKSRNIFNLVDSVDYYRASKIACINFLQNESHREKVSEFGSWDEAIPQGLIVMASLKSNTLHDAQIKMMQLMNDGDYRYFGPNTGDEK